MLTSIRQVNEQFFRKFFGLSIPIGDTNKKVLCRYARKSSYDYTEEQAQQVYPCVAIQDYVPVPKEEWYIDMHAYFGGKSFDGLRGYLYQRPIWMEFRYDVSIVSKSYNEYMALQDYFLQNFVYGKRFIFNQYFSGENAIGDIVPYTVRDTDIPRTDGVFETNYEFSCSVWLYPRVPEEIETIQQIVINFERKDKVKPAITEGSMGLSKNVEIHKDSVIQETPDSGRVVVVRYINKADADCTLTLIGEYGDKGISDFPFVLPKGGYADLSYSNTAGGPIHVRGVITNGEGKKRELILEQAGDNWILKKGVWFDGGIWKDDEYWKDSPDY